MRPLLRILGLWRNRAGWLAAGLVLALGALLAGVGLLTLAGAWIGSVVAGVALAAPLLLRAFGVARVVLRYAERLVTHDATFRALADLRVWFFRGLARQSAGGLGFRRAGDVLSRLVGDVEALDGLYLRILVPLAGAVLLLPVLVVVIGRGNLPLALLVVALLVVSAFLLPALGAGAAMAAGGGLSEAASSVRVAVLDLVGGLREVRAFGAEGRMLAAVQARETQLFAAQEAVARRATLASVAAFLCGQAALLAVLAVAGRNPAWDVAAAFLVIASFEACSGLPRAGVLAGYASAAATRVLEAAEQAPEAMLTPVDPVSPAALPARNDLRFESIGFGWQPDRRVLDGLTIDVPQGARVAILGPSGAGKSTLAALAMRVVAPQSGRVMLGGTDLATLPAEAVRARIAWLGQATHLFADTIRGNLLLGRPDVEEADLWAALDRAAIGDFVRGLPEQLDTWLGEGGASVSGGQARRIALARVLLSEAPILILDEPCAGLDSDTERAFLADLSVAATGRTVILIVHRLTGVERPDRIFRLMSGHAVAAAA